MCPNLTGAVLQYTQTYTYYYNTYAVRSGGPFEFEVCPDFDW